MRPNNPTPATAILVVDVNGDQRLDVVTWGQEPVGSGSGSGSAMAASGIQVYLQGSAATFGAPVITPVPSVDPSVVAADFNHDGFADLLVDGQAYLGDGTGAFTAAAVVPTVTTTTPFEIVRDVDGDGYDDVVELALDMAADTHVVAIAFNNGSAGGFASPIEVGPAGSVVSAVAGHYAATGVGLDLVVSQALFVQNAARVFTEASDMAVGIGGNGFGLSTDLNGDGRDDVVIDGGYVVQCAGSAATFSMGQSMPGEWTITNKLGGTSFGQLADLDADGRPDIVTFDALDGGQGAAFLEVLLQ